MNAGASSRAGFGSSIANPFSVVHGLVVLKGLILLWSPSRLKVGPCSLLCSACCSLCALIIGYHLHELPCVQQLEVKAWGVLIFQLKVIL